MTDHSDLIARLRAACVGRPSASIAWPHRILHEAADALSSQSLSLSEAREEIERLRKSERKAVDDLCRWRAAFQSFTPGGSEFFDPKAVREWAEGLKTQVFEANKRAVLAERKVLENSKARLADAPSKSPDPDLSSLRKGAEVMREAIEDAVEKLNTYRGAAVQTVIDQLEAALVSGSREDG